MKTSNMTGRPVRFINTFVAFDLETTGLPSLEYNKTKITEFAFVAASRENLLNTNMGIPRITHKLTICVNPYRMIHPRATDITGLSNDTLEKEKCFDKEACNLINLFLSRLTPPVCLVAHNGMKFDFPILLAEVAHSQMALPGDLLCIDSLIAFRQLFSEIPRELLPYYMQKRIKSTQPSRKIEESLETLTCESMEVVSEDRSFMQKINETTPKTNDAQNQACPTISTQLMKTIKAKRKLFSDGDDFQPSLQSFKLQDIYKFISGKEARDTHRAESDSSIVIACITGMGQEFIKWADDNAIPLNDVKKLR